MFFARHCLEVLDMGNPRAADEALSKLDDARALIGGTIEGDDEPATAEVRARPNSILVPDVVACDPTVWEAWRRRPLGA